ncbi:MAG: fibronectin type III domain-containing protein [Acidobacteriota bacterium]
MATTSRMRPSAALPAILVASLALGTLLSLSACGKKGDPLPPPRLVPTAVDDLAISQQGNDFLLELGYPRTTVGGGVLPPLDRLEVLSVAQPATSGSEGDTLSNAQFEAQGTPRLILNAADLDRATSGNRIFLRVPVPGLAEGVTDAESENWTFAVRTRAEGSEPSALSNLANLTPQRPPEPPRDLTVLPQPDGLTIRWQAPATDADEGAIETYNVYRREARSRAYRRDPATVVGGATEYKDSSARFGQRYIYTVTSVTQRRPLVESRLSGEAEVFYQDRFAPQAPPSLVALAEVGTVRVRWEPSPSGDAVGYHVYRRDTQAGDFRRITRDPVSGRELTDEGLRSGRTYSYRVTAVDAQGNEGDSSPETEATVR